MPWDEANICRVLQRAASDKKYCQSLLQNREAALAGEELEPEERTLLLAASNEQLQKMIENTEGKPWYARDMGAVGTLAKVGVVAAGVGLISSLSLGATGHVPDEVHARSGLYSIWTIEENYHQKHGVYGPIEALLKHDKQGEELARFVKDGKYVFHVEAMGETFTAVARHKTRPDTRPAFRVGPDGNIERLDPQELESTP